MSLALLGLTGLAILLTLWFGWRISDPPNSPETKHATTFLAVLPLSYDPDDARAARLAESFVDSTITLLAKLPDLSVMAHASMMEFGDEQLSVRLLRDEFGVTHSLRGSIETLEDELRLRIQLIDTATSQTVWSDSLEGNLSDVWLLQDEMAANLLDALAIQLESVERDFMLSRYTESAEALALYRQGLFLILPPSDIKRVQGAMQVFARVREIDPEFAGGYAGAAWVYALPVLFHNTPTPDENLMQALDFAGQAIDVDPGFGAGYAVLGFTQALSGEKAEALENERLAAALQPGDAFVQFLRAVTYVLLGIPEEAFAALDEAIRLNPVERRAPYLNVYSIGRSRHSPRKDYDLKSDLQVALGALR
jgi:TolB-like protein